MLYPLTYRPSLVRNPASVSCSVIAILLDGAPQPVSKGKARLKLSKNEGVRQMLVTLG